MTSPLFSMTSTLWLYEYVGADAGGSHELPRRAHLLLWLREHHQLGHGGYHGLPGKKIDAMDCRIKFSWHGLSEWEGVITWLLGEIYRTVHHTWYRTVHHTWYSTSHMVRISFLIIESSKNTKYVQWGNNMNFFERIVRFLGAICSHHERITHVALF